MMDSKHGFNEVKAIANYADTAPRLVPGLKDLRRMTTILLSEHLPKDGRVLILGAGGGLEIRDFAEAHSGWVFDGIDPSQEMLNLAETTLTPYAQRVNLHQGYIDIAPLGPFDGATSLLTLHFVSREERQRTLTEIRHRLKPGAPFVVAHLSFSQDADERQLWLSRYQAFAVASGIDPEHAEKARIAIGSRLPILSPQQDELILKGAGFSNISMFYTSFTFRGWVAYA